MNMLISVIVFVLMALRAFISVYIFVDSYVKHYNKGYILGVISYIEPIIPLIIYKQVIVKSYEKNNQGITKENGQQKETAIS